VVTASSTGEGIDEGELGPEEANEAERASSGTTFPSLSLSSPSSFEMSSFTFCSLAVRPSDICCGVGSQPIVFFETAKIEERRREEKGGEGMSDLAKPI
jgi:hypothetical protein